MRALLFLALLPILVPNAWAQEDSSEVVAWEVVDNVLGIRHLDVNHLSVAGDSTIYLTGNDGTWVWRRSGPDRFVEIRDNYRYSPIWMTSTGPLFVVGAGLAMSRDYFRTRPTVAVERGEAVIETH